MNQQTINIPEGFELVQTSETTFEIKKKKTNLPKTWEEFCKTHGIKTGEYFISTNSSIIDRIRGVRDDNYDRNLLPSKSDAKGILALIQLIQLRDCYNDGWKPDWENVQNTKHCIYYSGNSIVTNIHYGNHRILSFKTKELQDEFLANFEDLIEIAKDFI